ncbi:MAG: shikimate dehydrogenase [Ferruginibacter sp.]
MKQYGIIGFPLTHSFSKQYFTEKFQKEGIRDCNYETYPIKSIYEIEDIIKQNPDLRGLNITIPYKQLVIRHLDSFSEIPMGLNACNCIKIKEGKLLGYNTDVLGFEHSFLPHLKDHHKAALILGNGGATEAVKFILKKLGINYKIVSRKIHDGSELTYQDLGKPIFDENKIIINTTPLGTFPNINECPDIPYQFLTPDHFLFDVVYNPEKSLFLQKGEAAGASIKNGHEMLIIQAEESWRIWNEDDLLPG